MTGGSGFIGHNLCLKLVEEGNEVYSYDIKKWNYSIPIGLTPIYGDTLQGNFLNGMVRKVDVVFHLACYPFIPDSYVNPRKIIETDIIGTTNVLLAVRENEKRLIHYSSSEVYGGTITNPIDERHPTEPKSTYASSKLGAERLVYTFSHEHKVPFTILRQFNVMGPDDTHPRVMPIIISQLYNGDTVTLGNINSSRDFTYIDDAVSACVQTLTNDAAIDQTINIGTGISIRIEDLAHRIANRMKKNVKIASDMSKFRPLEVDVLRANNYKARRLLGWEPTVTLDEGLDRIIEWRKNHHYEWE